VHAARILMGEVILQCLLAAVLRSSKIGSVTTTETVNNHLSGIALATVLLGLVSKRAVLLLSSSHFELIRGLGQVHRIG
jgi:hypothetical protein